MFFTVVDLCVLVQGTVQVRSAAGGDDIRLQGFRKGPPFLRAE